MVREAWQQQPFCLVLQQQEPQLQQQGAWNSPKVRLIFMETENLYSPIYNFRNLVFAWEKARIGKTKKDYVIEFEKDLRKNLLKLHKDLINMTYSPEPLKTFILRDPKTRKISKSAFIDRVAYHALIRIIGPIFEKGFIYDSCANRIGKGTLFAIKRFEFFKRKVTNNLHKEALCLKADIKHYFQEVNHEILLNILRRKIKDEKVIWLIKKILENSSRGASNFAWRNYKQKQPSRIASRIQLCKKGMPLGNLTSQFFANVYLNKLDYFVKHILNAKYYICYVDDFIGFRIFYHYRLLRQRNLRKMLCLIEKYKRNFS